MALNELLFEAQQTLMQRNNVITNILGIPLIEIEQINPRINKLSGAMGVRYNNVGGDVDDPESQLDYEYEYVGAEIEFIANPIPRAPLGTGKVAFLCDDEMDANGKKIQVPVGSLSGEEYGWNRELLASHYAEGYWRIVDPTIDGEIQERYRHIIKSKMIDEDTRMYSDEAVEELIKDAVSRQMRGIRGSQKITVRTTATPVIKERVVSGYGAKAEIENHPLFQELRKQNADLNDKLTKLLADRPKRKYTKRKGTKKRTTKKKVATKSKSVEEPTGNLGG